MTQETKADNSESTPILDFLFAQNLVVSGRLDEAELLLHKNGDPSISIEALDLLARIAVQKCQINQAEKLWKTVLERDPNNEAAKAAIKRLESPWISIALIKRLAFLIGIAVSVCLSVFGLYTLFNFDRQSESQDAVHAKSSTQTEVTKSKYIIPGCFVYAGDRETKIVFNDGIFSFRCNLKKSAKKQLTIIAQLLENNAPNSRIVIEGHTDLISVRKNNLYKDNYELGMQRALTVAKYLKENYRIKEGRILVTSMGDTNQPFRETDYKSRLKNRTVIIRIIESNIS